MLAWAISAAISTHSLGGTLLEIDATRRLSVAWARAAIALVADPGQPDPENFAGALEVAMAAAELTPLDPEAWRVVLGIGEAVQDGLPSANVAMQEALSRLGKLDPHDPVIRLARLTDAAERGMVAEDRNAALEKLLQPANIKALGPEIAARLTFDRALLQKRRADVTGWVASLRQAFALDKAFAPPIEALAGYQVGNGSPPSDVAHTLVAVIAANPGDLPAINALARMCLNEGLYAEADRLLELAGSIALANLRFDLIDDLIADRMLALWGMGKHEQAEKVAKVRQGEINAKLRRRLGDETATAQDTDSLGPSVTLPAALSAVRAAVSTSGKLPDAAKALEAAIKSLDMEAKNQEGDEKAMANTSMRMAWLELTLGDPDKVEPLVESADKVAPLTDAAKARFSGWLKYRRKQPEAALAELQPISESDAAAKLGMGLALQDLGRTKEAAVALVAVAREQRDTAIGLYASDRLFDLVKVRPPPAATAKSLQEAVAAIPTAVFSLIGSQGQALLCAVTFGGADNTLEPVSMNIRIQNRTALTLAIGPQSPIEGRAALMLDAMVTSAQSLSLPPWIFPIDRRLDLKPGEVMEFTVDLGRTTLMDVLLGDPIAGAIISGRIISNFRLTTERVHAGFMGSVGETSLLRIPAVRIGPGWCEDALSEIRHPDSSSDMVKLVMYAYHLSREGFASGKTDMDPAWSEICEAWTRLPAAAQAWTLMVLPKSNLTALEPMLEAARVSKDPMVRISYLLRWVESPDDVMLVAAARGDGRLAITAAGVKARLVGRARDAAAVNQGLEDAGVFGGNKSSFDVPDAKR